MKALKRVLVAIVMVVMTATAASAQFRIGPRLGVEVNSLKFNEDVFNSDNRAGFTGGLMAEFNIPVVNLAFDASVMYVRRVKDINFKNEDGVKSNSDYIEIPINFKWKIGLPVVGKIVTPYIFTGPSFAFLTSKRAISEAFSNKKTDIAWNFGVGLQLFTHLQVGASYGLGMTKAVETLSSYQGEKIDGKNKYWTITAAWLF